MRVSDYIFEITSLLELSRAPFSKPVKMGVHFDRAVSAYRRSANVSPANAFWKVTRQIAWQASSVDFDKKLQQSILAFEQRKARKVSDLPVFSLFKRYEVFQDEHKIPLCTDDQGVLMRVNVMEPVSIVRAENAIRSWTGWNVTPLQIAMQQALANRPTSSQSDVVVPLARQIPRVLSR